jgi:hypothetical protein
MDIDSYLLSIELINGYLGGDDDENSVVTEAIEYDIDSEVDSYEFLM